jgi:hypothetical protein
MVASLIDYVPCRHEGAGPVSASRRHAVTAQDVPDILKKPGHHLQQVPVRHCWGGRLKTSGVTC